MLMGTRTGSTRGTRHWVCREHGEGGGERRDRGKVDTYKIQGVFIIVGHVQEKIPIIAAILP